MNPRDLPEVAAELLIEMHEVRPKISALSGRVDRLEQTVEKGFRALREEQRGLREETRALPQQRSAAMFKALAPFLNRPLTHDDQLKAHATRLGRLENPSAQ